MANKDPRTTFLDGLLAATAPKADTVEIIIAEGFSISFRVLTDYTEMVKLRRESSRFVEGWPSLKATDEYKPFAKTDRDVVALAYYMGRVQVSEPALGTLGFLRIAQDRANVFDSIKDGLNEGQFALASAENEAIQEAKNESSETLSGKTA